jgi:hypothetical protein
MNSTFGKHEALYIFTIRVVIPGTLGPVALQKQALFVPSVSATYSIWAKVNYKLLYVC